ncbi:MAG: arsenite efflux transporter metallochaperone ArsD [Candidatus Pacearchaeota archaeon]
MVKDNLTIYEGVMCCQTGLCGPEPDKTLIDLNETLKKLQNEFSDLEINRANITHNLNMFLENKEIFQLVKEKGQEILPITTINGKIIANQKYLKYDEVKEIIKETKK